MTTAWMGPAGATGMLPVLASQHWRHASGTQRWDKETGDVILKAQSEKKD